MRVPSESSDLSDCGCCEGLRARTPAPIFNRPGLREIGYRVGTYSLFRQSMLANLTRQDRPALAGLRTRADDDFSIALLDAWAVVGDVLTFYIERTAQEHYLPTATERRSVDALVHLAGYQPRPGVAAATWLAFTLETVPDAANAFRPQTVPGIPEQVPVTVGTRVQSIPGPGELPQTFETVEPLQALADWNAFKPRLTAPRIPRTGDQSAWLAGVGLDLNPGDRLLFVASDWDPAAPNSRWDLRRVVAVEPAAGARRTFVHWDGALTNLVAAEAIVPVGVFALRQQAALFGYNAPDPRLFSDEVRARLGNIDEWTFDEIVADGTATVMRLNTVVRGVEPGGWLVLTNPAGGVRDLAPITRVLDEARSAYGISAQETTLTVNRGHDLLTARYDGGLLRRTAVLLGSEPLPLAEAPIAEPVAGTEIRLAHGLDPIAEPRTVILRGKTDTDGSPVVEAATVVAVVPDGETARLMLAERLGHAYDRTSLVIFGNVAAATHGETVSGEVLGSGDGAQPYQRFTLRRDPLTYVRGETPGTITSTLEVWVNSVRWTEVRTLYGHGPRDRVYSTSLTDEGKTIVQFGDGVSGARLPTGQDNVVATYRAGSGFAGAVAADQLSLLMTRPLGVRGATNPLPPIGAASRQEADDSRENAPRSVLTLGRIVALQDYEDFARDFPGIDKAAAVWTWDGTRRGVLITVAGEGGELVPEGSLLQTELTAAITGAGSRRVPFGVKSYRPASFRLTASLRVGPDRQPETVLAAVRDALAARFSFSARGFGQIVTLSEVYGAIHAVPGVVAATVAHLYRGSDARLEPFLTAAAPAPGDAPTTLGAELLTLDPASLDDLEVSP